jgi:DSF synthase
MNAVAEVRSFVSPQFEQIETRFDPEYGVLWGFMDPKPRPTFNRALLEEARQFAESLTIADGYTWSGGQRHAINYVVEASKVPGVYNLGGDMALFRDAIARQDKEMLLEYGRACIDNVYAWTTGFDQTMTTIALVQGDALGGGFESALSAMFLVAEESSRMGFPEVLFNLFPGMGAYSLLVRKVGRRVAEEVITSGVVYTAKQLYDMGIVDVLAPDGAGEAAVYSFVRKHAKQANGRRALEAVRREVEPLTKDELLRVVEIWADAALRLTERDLRLMERLVRAQNRAADPSVAPATVTSLQRVAAQA